MSNYYIAYNPAKGWVINDAQTHENKFVFEDSSAGQKEANQVLANLNAGISYEYDPCDEENLNYNIDAMSVIDENKS